MVQSTFLDEEIAHKRHGVNLLVRLVEAHVEMFLSALDRGWQVQLLVSVHQFGPNDKFLRLF